ncbi:MAG: Chorismate pyruvate-lyase [Candidatus Methanoperedens nitroreducens]|uniref:Chorismate pyruvate-lyase n=1 Tax=Candidatus Methanoperedens nitratireducens TaxID=1392998 RepID=A0A0P8AB91_9EURY|nr:chorismate lyase [Candidatus Methanoperedens sp. BLZ2]KPQ41232.1 MAG: Chorismate pyruvate-lyase [Candidatus Methanoperedens sp. BLZ1]CAG1000878.1 chorismate--pyruvate lyase [Methanosarcinales archaeon]
MQDVLRRPDIPACLRICAGTDGSVTQLLEVLTGKSVKVETISQGVIKATREIARLLDIETGEDVNDRLVTLKVDDIVYVLAKSLAPINRMPEAVRADLMRADIPIGKILREHKLETRRDILKMEIVHRNFFGELPVLSREYKIIYENAVLMWINECFPVDERWKM